MKANDQVYQLTKLSLLPQLMPAPQALIRNSRPLELKPESGKVIGSTSGNVRDSVNHIAHLLHSREHIEDYHVRCELLTKLDEGEVSARQWGFLALRSALGCSMSIALLGLSIARSDGFALLATLLLSFLSTLTGIGNRWELKLKERSSKRPVPPDRIVVKNPNGSFRVIICQESIARELYWHPETCHYRFGEKTYRFLSLIGTLALMIGVVCLGNSTLELQIGFAASYLILNAVYWIVAALPPKWHWDTDCYKVERVPYGDGEKNDTFTKALWKAIAVTDSVAWVRIGQIAPVSGAWRAWVDMADQVLHEARQENGNGAAYEKYDLGGGKTLKLPAWNPEAALTQCLEQQWQPNP